MTTGWIVAGAVLVVGGYVLAINLLHRWDEKKRIKKLQEEYHPVSELDQIIHSQWDYQAKKKRTKKEPMQE